MNAVLRQVRRLVALEDSREFVDRELLRRFVDRRDEMAFAALVDRHGPLVLSACKRQLQNEQDAEDVLQATFLVFVRKAHSIRRSDSVGSWLFGVAYRLARKVRVQMARQRADEIPAMAMERAPVADLAGVEEMQLALDEELERLPQKYRAPILLCCLEGKSRDEAARQLGWAEGAVKIRLERGRELLRNRLARRGFVFSMVLFSTLPSKSAMAALPARLAAGTIDAGMKSAIGASQGAFSASVVSLADSAIRTLALAKAKTLAGVLLLTGAIGLGVSAWIDASLAREQYAPVAGERVALSGPTAVQTRASDHAEKIDNPQSVIEPILLATPNAAEAPEGPTIVGILRPDREDRQMLTVRIKEKDTQYALAPNVQIVIDGKDAGCAGLDRSCRVRITLSSDGRQVNRVVAEGPTVSCRFVSANVSQNIMTVWWPSDSPGLRLFPVVPNAMITLKDKPAMLTDLPDGMNVSLVLTVDGKTVRKISGPSGPIK